MKLALVAAVLLAAPLGAPAAVVMIDDFSSATGAYPMTRTTVTPGVTSGFIETGLTGAIGGARVATLGLHAADLVGLDSTSLTVAPAVGTGLLDFSSTIGAEGRSVYYYGDFAGYLPAISLAIPDGSTADFHFLDFDLPAGQPLLVNLELANGADFESKYASVTTAGPQTLTFDLDQFSPGIRANVTGISIRYFAPKAADFRLDSITMTVPEPTTLTLLAPAAALLRRRRQA